MNQENLKFDVTLSGTYWDKKPQYSVWLDNKEAVHSEIVQLDAMQTFSFEREVAEGEHTLSIRLENKTNQDTVLENGEIVKDMLLNIDDIVIDDISLGNLLWTGEYLLDKPQQFQGKTVTKLDNCVNLGWNGTYVLKFSSPFYIWLLEKL